MADVLGSGTAAGTSTATATAGVQYITTGRVSGSGTLKIRDSFGAGTAAGTSVLTGDGIRQRLALTVPIRGVGIMSTSEPEPMQGNSAMAAHVEVETLTSPIAATTTPDVVLRWGQLLQRGDLDLYIRQTGGEPFTPFRVEFEMFTIQGQSLIPIGPRQTPAKGDIGEFYATGTVGQFGGQPGDWLVRWSFQPDSTSTIQQIDEVFVVQDAVAADDPTDQTERANKFGWN